MRAEQTHAQSGITGWCSRRGINYVIRLRQLKRVCALIEEGEST
jgi:hypothetical protein